MAYGVSTNTKSTPSVSKAITKPLSATTKPQSSLLSDLQSRLKPQNIISLTKEGFKLPATNFRGTQNDETLVLNRDVFDKVAFNNTIDTNFSELDQLPPDLSFFDPNLATVGDFFTIYQNLFFQIPKYGETNSHEFLVLESTEYSKVIENQEQIDALLEEIVELREENLQLQLDINELLGVKTTLDQAIRQSGEGANLEDLLEQEANLGAEQSNSSSDLVGSGLGIDSAGNTLPSQGGGSGGSDGGGGGGIPGVTFGFTNAFQQGTGGDPLPGGSGLGGTDNSGVINPGTPKY
tara:strand:- start:38 stop:916 length:879 start_codon:yes stop_codon:yes gene_type:complete